ncbi:cation transporter [Weissella diestrammenae]|uniref:Cation transporter n=1 Tax=Weissella diestrammenae TaxID=1162633 RepID=A0A7G9T681_9LACO|nr:cation diffusion facilitator family transporter [Weissella diestrammenae]MCM0583350.1 cation transporter [Weissella diestrammenae]QNN75606.1 cation transporter [Weissella diestrammenae]
MAHQHEIPDATNKRFLIATVMNVIITVAELFGGIISGSLALISDAVHNFTDVLSLIIAWIAQLISGKRTSERNTFGYRRAQIIAAFVNSIFLMVISIVLLIESVRGFMAPHPIKGMLMLIIAIIGLVANVVTGLMLMGGKANLNTKAALLHVLGDALSSVGVIFAAIMIYFFNWIFLDPLMTLIVAGYIIFATYPVLKDATQILMQANPILNFEQIKADILTCPYVLGAHHFHAWQIDEEHTMLSFHVTMRNQLLSEVEKSSDEMRRVIMEKYHVSHVTIQPEVDHEQETVVDYDE